MTLTEFLLTRIAEDKSLITNRRTWSPERVLEECEVKRRIVKQARLALQISDGVPESEPDEINNNGRKHGYGQAFDVVLELMARPYAKHPDYQKEWAE